MANGLMVDGAMAPNGAVRDREALPQSAAALGGAPSGLAA